MRRASGKDEELIRSFLASRGGTDPFMLADLEHYGVESDNHFFLISDGGLLLRFHGNLIAAGKVGIQGQDLTRLVSDCGITAIMGLPEDIETMGIGSGWKRTAKRLMIAEGVIAPAQISYTVAKAEDAGRIYGFLSMEEGLKDLYSEEMIRERIETDDGIHLFAEDSEGIFAHINSAGDNGMTAMVGGLCVRPDHRHQGIAHALVSALSSIYAAAGKKLEVFTSGNENLFADSGFVDIGTWCIMAPEKEDQ